MTAQAEHPAVGPPGQLSPRGRRIAAIVAFLVVIAAAVVVLVLRAQRRHVESAQRAELEARQSRGLRIAVTRVETTPTQRTITLPGDVHGYEQTTLYAKLAGYVREVRVERGQRVSRGQVLATIESPESAKDVSSALHDAQITKVNADRASRLAPSGVVAIQDAQNAVAAARIAQANLGRAQAVLDYTVVRAPFDGVITARYVDSGALLPAATGSTQSALPIVDVADVDTLRIFIYVGQDVAPFVRPGDAVTLWQAELPAVRIPAAVRFTTGALDPRTRTMQVEIDLDNRKWGLLPGTFANADLRIAEPAVPLIPDAAIVIRDARTMVATVIDGRVHYVPVDLGYNDGIRVRVLQGVRGGEMIGLDVPVRVQEGEAVQIAEAAPQHGGG
jgi:RND family efflux transporter MFP subunit